MIFPYLLVMAGQLAASQPTVSGAAAATGIAGACAGPGNLALAATVRISWIVANADSATYDIKVYENGALLQTLSGASTSYEKTVVGSVEGGSIAQWTSNWTYRVDVVRKSDGVAVATTTTATPWVKTYGGC